MLHCKHVVSFGSFVQHVSHHELNYCFFLVFCSEMSSDLSHWLSVVFTLHLSKQDVLWGQELSTIYYRINCPDRNLMAL